MVFWNRLVLKTITQSNQNDHRGIVDGRQIDHHISACNVVRQDLTPCLMKACLLGHRLSMAVGDALFDLFKAADIDAIVTESSVCKIQLAEGSGLEVFHPLQLL